MSRRGTIGTIVIRGRSGTTTPSAASRFTTILPGGRITTATSTTSTTGIAATGSGNGRTRTSSTGIAGTTTRPTDADGMKAIYTTQSLPEAGVLRTLLR